MINHAYEESLHQDCEKTRIIKMVGVCACVQAWGVSFSVIWSQTFQ